MPIFVVNLGFVGFLVVFLVGLVGFLVGVVFLGFVGVGPPATGHISSSLRSKVKNFGSDFVLQSLPIQDKPPNTFTLPPVTSNAPPSNTKWPALTLQKNKGD